MLRKTRTKAQRRADRQRLNELQLRGATQVNMAQLLELSRRQVESDLQYLGKQQELEYVADYETQQRRELAKIDHLEMASWTAWDRSQLDREERTVTSDGQTKHAERTQTQQFGQPAYLKQVAWCIARRCALLGLDAPRKLDLNQSREEPSEEELAVIAKRLGIQSPRWSALLLENAMSPSE